MPDSRHKSSKAPLRDDNKNSVNVDGHSDRKGKARVPDPSISGDENMATLDSRPRQGLSDALDHVPGESWQLEPLSRRVDSFSRIESTPRKALEWPKEPAPIQLALGPSAVVTVRPSSSNSSTSSRPQSSLVESHVTLENGEIPQDVISIETYVYLGWTAVKAAELFQTWRHSGSDEGDSLAFFYHGMDHGLDISGDEDYQTLAYPKAHWERRLRELGIDETTSRIVLDDPGADVFGRPLQSLRQRPRRSAISWTRQVMHSRWFWLHWFKQIHFVGPHFTDNLLSDTERWYCSSRFTSSLPAEICSIQTLLFVGFDIRRAALIFTEWKAHLDANPDPFTDSERQESLLHDALDWLELHEDYDMTLEDGDWSSLFRQVGMSKQLCQASEEALFLGLRGKLRWDSALTCLKDIVLARWRLMFRMKKIAYPGPDTETVSTGAMPLSEARYGSELL